MDFFLKDIDKGPHRNLHGGEDQDANMDSPNSLNNSFSNSIEFVVDNGEQEDGTGSIHYVNKNTHLSSGNSKHYRSDTQKGGFYLKISQDIVAQDGDHVSMNKKKATIEELEQNLNEEVRMRQQLEKKLEENENRFESEMKETLFNSIDKNKVKQMLFDRIQNKKQRIACKINSLFISESPEQEQHHGNQLNLKDLVIDPASTQPPLQSQQPFTRAPSARQYRQNIARTLPPPDRLPSNVKGTRPDSQLHEKKKSIHVECLDGCDNRKLPDFVWN